MVSELHPLTLFLRPCRTCVPQAETLQDMRVRYEDRANHFIEGVVETVEVPANPVHLQQNGLNLTLKIRGVKERVPVQSYSERVQAVDGTLLAGQASIGETQF